MKKHLLLFALILISYCSFSQDTITGWTFPKNSGADSLNANLGLTANHSYDIRFEGTDTVYNVIYFSNGASTYAATASGWDNGTDAKFWSVKFKANNYKDFRLFSKQQADATNPGPRDWKVQWKLSGGTYADVTNGSVTVANDWTSGVINNLPVPVTGQGTSSIYIRWILTSDKDINGGTLAASGIARIDDIVITASSTLGTNDILFTNRILITPNPNHGEFTVSSSVPMDHIRVLDLSGRVIRTADNAGLSSAIHMQNLAKGQYVLSVIFDDQENWYNRPFIIE